MEVEVEFLLLLLSEEALELVVVEPEDHLSSCRPHSCDHSEQMQMEVEVEFLLLLSEEAPQEVLELVEEEPQELRSEENVLLCRKKQHSVSAT